MEEFDAHDIGTSIKLDNYECERRPTKSPPQPPLTDNANGEEDNTIENDTDLEYEEEPSLFAILHGDEEENDDNQEDDSEPIGQK